MQWLAVDEDDVVRLDVAVEQSRTVEHFHGGSDLPDQVKRSSGLQPPPEFEPVAESVRQISRHSRIRIAGRHDVKGCVLKED